MTITVNTERKIAFSAAFIYFVFLTATIIISEQFKDDIKNHHIILSFIVFGGIFMSYIAVRLSDSIKLIITPRNIIESYGIVTLINYTTLYSIKGLIALAKENSTKTTNSIKTMEETVNLGSDALFIVAILLIVLSISSNQVERKA